MKRSLHINSYCIHQVMLRGRQQPIADLGRRMGGAAKLWNCVLPLLDRTNPSELRELGAKLIKR